MSNILRGLFLVLFFLDNSYSAFFERIPDHEEVRNTVINPVTGEEISLLYREKDYVTRGEFRDGVQPSFEDLIRKGFLVHTGSFLRNSVTTEDLSNIVIGRKAGVSSDLTFWAFNHLVSSDSFLFCGRGTALVKLENILSQVVSLGFHEVMTRGAYTLKKGDSLILFPAFRHYAEKDSQDFQFSLSDLTDRFSRNGVGLHIIEENYDTEEKERAIAGGILRNKISNALKATEGWVVSYQNLNTYEDWFLTQSFLVDGAPVRNDLFFSSIHKRNKSLSIGNSKNTFPSLDQFSFNLFQTINWSCDNVSALERRDSSSSFASNANYSRHSGLFYLYPEFFQTALRAGRDDSFLKKRDLLFLNEEYKEYISTHEEKATKFLGNDISPEGHKELVSFLRAELKEQTFFNFHLENRFFFLGPEVYHNIMESLYKRVEHKRSQGVWKDELEDSQGWQYFLLNVVPKISEGFFDYLKIKWPSWGKLDDTKRSIVEDYFRLLNQLKKYSPLWAYEVERYPLSRRDLYALKKLPQVLKIGLYRNIFDTDFLEMPQDWPAEAIRTQIEGHMEQFIATQELLHQRYAIVPWSHQ